MPVTVVRGDTLNKIAAANNITLAQLLAANPDIDNPDLIRPGDVINLPGDTETEETETEETKTEEESGEPPPGLLSGGETIRVDGGLPGGEDDRWYQVYEFPPGSGFYISYQFNNVAQLGAAIGETYPTWTLRTQSWFDEKVLVQAPAEQIIGAKGSFGSMAREIIADAASAAGIHDPGLAGQIAADPEMQNIMAQAIVGNWTPEQVKAAQRNTTFWKEVLYPGIERFYGQTTDPERAWAAYVQNVQGALIELGYERDADGTFNSHIKRMLDAGIDDTTFLALTPTFVRAQQNSEFADTLSEWSQRDLGRTVEFGEWFDLIAGEPLPELQQVAENATLAYAAQQQGTAISEGEIRDIASRTELTEAEARRAFSEVNQAVLALGETGLARGNLTRDDILSAAAGAAPASGRSIDEVRLQVAKVARENDLFDEEKLSFYVGFDPLGRPVRPGLQALSPEGA